MSTNATLKQQVIYQKISKRPKKGLPKVQIKTKLTTRNENINSNRNDLPLSKIPFKKKSSLPLVEKDLSDDDFTNDEYIFPLEESLSNLSIVNSIKENNEFSSLNLSNFLTNISLKNKLPSKFHNRIITQGVNEEYSDDIIDTLLKEENTNEKFLTKHTITNRMRSRMVDWMIEVLSNYRCSEETYFISVGIMDKYFQLCEVSLKPEDLHLIGVTSMFIASKYQDIYPLQLRVIYEKIAHKKLTCEQIKKQERKISKALNYEYTFPSILDFINIFIENIFTFKKFSVNEKNEVKSESIIMENDKENKEMLEDLYNEKMLTLLRLVCIYISKMNCYDYELIGKKPSILAASSIFVSLKICEQIKKENYISEYFMNKLISLSKYTEEEIVQCAQIILKNAQEFDELFPKLENLKKIYFNSIINFSKNL